jgi:hypothetical protein
MKNDIDAHGFIVSPEATASFHDDGIVILHTGKGTLFTANKAGARVWHGIEQRLPSEAIAEEISGVYRIAQSTAREHIFRFLVQLERQALIRREVAS